MDVYLIRPKELFISCEVVEGISDHKAVLQDLDQGRSTICSEEDRPVALFSFAAERANDVIKYRSAACGTVGRVVFLGVFSVVRNEKISQLWERILRQKKQ